MSKVIDKTPKITQNYGSTHTGVDLVSVEGGTVQVLCKADGTVLLSQDGKSNAKGTTGNASYGNFLKINHANGYDTLYAHMQSGLKVKNGTNVKEGQVIGIMGNSGNSYGTHLHFEVFKDNKRINPTEYIMADLPISKPTEQPKQPEATKTLEIKERVYIVLKGDNLTGIAKKVGSTVDKIYNDNKILIDSRNKTILSKKAKWVYPGQNLIIK